ncbi:MAG: ComEC/Rec2 family competence protein [Paludibacteraceae bacterium]
MSRYPMAVLLLPLVAIILLCYYTGKPIDLLRDTEADYLDSLQLFRMVLTDYPRERAKTVLAETEVLARSGGGSVERAEGKVYVYLLPDSTDAARNREALLGMQIGDTLLVRTRVQRGGVLGKFDYGNYLRLQGIVGTAVVWKDQWKRLPAQPRTQRWNPRCWQRNLYRRYRALGIEGGELATLGALTLGYKEDLEPDLKRSFQCAGAAHVLAVSGLHTGIIYAVVLALLTLGGRCKPMYCNRAGRCALSAAVVLVMWGYAFLTGLTPSVVRSVVMLTVVEVGRMCRRRGTLLNTVLFAAWLILLVRPRDLFSVSFQLSFTAVAAIVLLAPDSPVPVAAPSVVRRMGRRVANYVFGLLSVSLAAQLGTLPLTLYYFGQCSNYFMLTNMVVLPLAWLIVLAGFATLLCGWIPCLGVWMAQGTKALVWVLNHTVGWVESLPGSVTLLTISMPMVVLLYVAIACGYWGLKRSLWWMIPVAVSLSAFCGMALWG